MAEFELEMVEAVAAGTLAAAAERLERQFRLLGERVPATWRWSSVYENSVFVLEAYRRQLDERTGKSAGTSGEERGAIDAVLSVLGELAGKGTRKA